MSNRLPLPGDLIDGRYRVQRAIGAGSMGAVYEASHHVTGKQFALKWLMPGLTRVPDAVERFIREARIGALIEHPNLVEVYDIGQDADSLYIVMELLEGEPLSERLARGPLPPRAACELLCPCMEAVAAAHAARVIHRDLKPANIFVCTATRAVPEHARVLDFGVSKLAGGSQLDKWSMTAPGLVLGTPDYMAPEQMRGEDIDARADVYAFGVILYEALSGELPFQAESFADLVAQVLTATPRPIEKLTALPAGLASIVGKAMAREPADRFESIQALLEALAPYRARSYELRPTLLGLVEQPLDKASARVGSPGVLEPLDVPRPPRSSSAGPIVAFLGAVAFVVASTWAAGGRDVDEPLQTSASALQQTDLDETPPEPEDRSGKPAASPTSKVRALETLADAREATKAAKAAADRERRALPQRRTTSLQTPAAARVVPNTDLKERPITSLRLDNGLYDPFEAR